MSEMW